MRTIVTTLAAAALLAAPATAAAQISVGPTVAFHEDFDLGVGAQVQAPMPQLHEGVGLLGDFTFFFPSGDGVDYFEVNGNLTWDVPVENSPVAPFALGGLNVARVSVDTGFQGVDASDTEVGLNVGGGIAFDAGALRPQVGAKIELSGGEGFVVFGSIPFSVGN